MMEWVLRSAQIHCTFSNLGFAHRDGYHVNENCNAALESILHNILIEDKQIRNYRRSINFGQNIRKDLIPLLIHAKEDKTLELLINILANLTIPIECLLSIDSTLNTDFGRHTIYEINYLLVSTKNAFTDHRTTRVIIDFLKKNLAFDQKAKLLPEQCSNINNSLLLLRNILHIPEGHQFSLPNYSGSYHSVQNQILWNLFSQSIDKVLMKLMSVPDAGYWGVTMVQFVALLYKDQHVGTLQKMLNTWLENSSSESSEDNESNTSPPGRGSDDSSPLMTSEPTSDSSDTGASGKCNDDSRNSLGNDWNITSDNHSQNSNQSVLSDSPINDTNDPNVSETYEPIRNSIGNSNKCDNIRNMDTAASCTSGILSEQSGLTPNRSQKKNVIYENSDCGYGTQIDNQEFISSSSNDDDIPMKKPVHQKPHKPKQRPNIKMRTGISLQDRKRKKIVKRGRLTIINVRGLTHNTPTDDNIANVLKEFTVDFLLKGYKSLVQLLHNEILTNLKLEIDISHFFWLMTYFLKFATQLEIEFKYVDSVLSYDIVSYLTAEGVNLCEEFELAIKLDANNLAPRSRRLHLVVTSLRELVEAIDSYTEHAHLSNGDRQAIIMLQIKICETVELRSLLVLLLHHYDPKHHTKQYLQDLIVTNHMLLVFLDRIMKFPEYKCSVSMVDHIRQFASDDIMFKYGLLLENYYNNGEMVNDCIFTIMHHVGSEVGGLETLLQSNLLDTFTSILKSDLDICEDWADLIECVINMHIMNKTHTIDSAEIFRSDINSYNDRNCFRKSLFVPPSQIQESQAKAIKMDTSNASNERWTEDEISCLGWMYMQCKTLSDVIGELMKMLKDDGIIKSRNSVVRELFNQTIINEEEFEIFMQSNRDTTSAKAEVGTLEGEVMREDEASRLCKELAQDGYSKYLKWVQKALLDACYAKIYLEKRKLDATAMGDSKLMNFELFKKNAAQMPVMSPVSYHSLLRNMSVPLVSWNCEQATICKDMKFLQLLHKLGFHMPFESGKVFVRIPYFWTADFMYLIAGKLAPIDTSKLKFSVNEFAETSAAKPGQEGLIYSEMNRPNMTEPHNYYQVHNQNYFPTMVNYTPTPGCSYHSEANEIDSQNWLKVVQQSQQFKLPLNMESHVQSQQMEIMMGTTSGITTSATCVAVAPVMIIPTIMTIKKELSTYNMHIVDNGMNEKLGNKSSCDTATIASDLTRMYVSDEEEKHGDAGAHRTRSRSPLRHGRTRSRMSLGHAHSAKSKRSRLPHGGDRTSSRSRSRSPLGHSDTANAAPVRRARARRSAMSRYALKTRARRSAPMSGRKTE